MKTRFSNSELSHVWAQQVQGYGKGSNMYFEGKVIYSYGRHFPIAEFKPNNIVFFNKRGYSNSTAKHKNYVWRSIDRSIYTVFDVVSFHSHIDNITSYVNETETAIQQASKSRKYVDLYLNRAIATINETEKYISAMDFNISCLPSDVQDKLITFLNDKDNLLSPEKLQALKEAEKVRKALKAEKQKGIIQEWRNFERDYLGRDIDKIILRVNGDYIESSLGAKALITEAKRLYKMLMKKKDIHGFKLGNYTAMFFKGGILKIGCHHIQESEINYIAKQLNWDNLK
jgi:signal peptidase I